MTSDTVSFPALGRYGRMGNAMFQIAATYAHARRLGLEPRFPPWEWRELFELPPEWFTLPPWEEPIKVTSGPGHHCLLGAEYIAGWNYAEIPEQARVLHGYFQSPLFWHVYEADIRHRFTRAMPSRILDSENSTLIAHVRMGDYCAMPDYHPVLHWEEYYHPALLKMFEDNTERLQIPLIIVSDDPDYCVNKFRNVLVSSGNEEVDLLLMVGSKYLIIANSSFSWWGAYLSEAKVIYPKQWFGPALADNNASQLVMPEWGWVGI